MPAASNILRQAAFGIQGIARGRQLMKHRRHSHSSEVKQVAQEECRPIRKVRIFSSSHRDGWIQAFCALKKNDLFIEVDREFIVDAFNLHGLSSQVIDFQESLHGILGKYKGSFQEDECRLYGLIHRRFILSGKGLDAMQKKFKVREFQKCPRSCCEDQTCLPVGLSDEPGVSAVKFFCPRCEDVFAPLAQHHHDIDGAFFGPTFPHLLLMTHPLTMTKPRVRHSSTSGYVPRIFGFKIHKPAAKLEELA